MKASIKATIRTVALGFALLTNTVPSWGGITSVAEVSIDPGQGASGTVSAARYSADTRQNIGCVVLREPSYTTMFCYAVDKDRHVIRCDTVNPNLVAVADSITDYSFIHFTVNPGTATCSSVLISNSSAFLH